jgi:hypothetical protein
MTIKIAKTVTENVFESNEWPLFDPARAARYSRPLPAITIIEFVASRPSASEELDEWAKAAATEAVAFLASVLRENEYRTLLFVSQGPWQSANRIVKYRKLWKEHLDLVQTKGVRHIGAEVEINSASGIRFVGLLEVGGEAFIKAVNLVRTDSACAIIQSKRPEIDSEASVRSIFASAFPTKNGDPQVNLDWMTLALHLCPQSDILMRVTGRFDDREASVDVIAAKGVMTLV